MSSSRLSGLNIALLVLTVLSLMFGAYGFISGGLSSGSPSANHARLADFNDELSDTQPTATGGGDDYHYTPAPREEKTTTEHADHQPLPNPTPRPGPNAKPGPEFKAQTQPTDHGEAVITGTVKSSDNTPVAGATVLAVRSDLDLTPPVYSQNDDLEEYRRKVANFLTRSSAETRTTTTDKQGAFRFQGLDPARAYDVTARADGGGSARQERVAAGDSVLLLLAPQSMFHGRVETQDHKPVTKFTLKVWPLNRKWSAKSREFESKDGKFDMPCDGGSMEAEVSAPGYTQDKPQSIEVGPNTGEIVITVEQAAILTGVVTDKNGNPLANVSVREGAAPSRNRGWNQSSSGGVRTDSKGRYRFDTLTPKETKITASMGEVDETQTTTLVKGENKLDFSIDVGAVLSLRFSGPDGKPVDPDNVWFQVKKGNNWARPARLPRKEPGLAEYAGLPPGEYTMTVRAASYPAIKKDIEVTAGTNELTLNFTTGAILSGTVASSSGSQVSNISVRLRKQDEKGWGGWSTGRYAQVQEDGSFKLGPAEPGDWLVEVYTTGGSWTKVYSESVSLSEGQNQHNITVDAGATVIVKLVDDTGKPLSWGNVRLASQQQGGKSFNGRSNSEGVVTISFVPVGNYDLFASARGLAAPTQFAGLRAGDNQFTVTMQKPNCCRLTYVYPGTKAGKAGMKAGDLVIEYNGQTITSWSQLGREIRKTKSKDDVLVLVDRGGSMLTFNVKGGTLGIEGTDGVR